MPSWMVSIKLLMNSSLLESFSPASASLTSSYSTSGGMIGSSGSSISSATGERGERGSSASYTASSCCCCRCISCNLRTQGSFWLASATGKGSSWSCRYSSGDPNDWSLPLTSAFGFYSGCSARSSRFCPVSIMTSEPIGLLADLVSYFLSRFQNELVKDDDNSCF